MRYILVSSILVLALSGCSFGIMSNNTDTVNGNTGTTDTVAKVTPNQVGSGTIVSLNYTLRGDSQDGAIIETTLQDVAMANNLYTTGAQYQPFQVIIGSNGVIPGFEQGLIGMKKGEKKTIMVTPELGYGTEPVSREVPKYQIAPVLTITQDKAVFGDTVTQTVEKSQLRQDMQGAKVGDVFTGANDATAKVTAVTDTVITLAISNTDNPFYKKKLEVGAVANSPDGSATFKITKIEGTGVTLEVTNKQSPFFDKKFAVGESIDTPQGKITIQDIKEDVVTVAQ